MFVKTAKILFIMKDEELFKNFGLHFKLARLKKGLSQSDLAEMLESHERYISDIECGRRNITLRTINKFANALNVSFSELFSFDK